MKYHKTVLGQFVKRINRFIAEVLIEGKMEQVHVKNTGRLRELLLEGAEIILEPSRNPNRKTRFSLIAVKANGHWVNIDSQAPNEVAFEALKEGKLKEYEQPILLKREVTYGESRFDLFFEEERQKVFMEVKGVTLVQDGVAMFPDAPTTRGAKHVMELKRAVQDGYGGAVLFVIQRGDASSFSPNREMDKAFADALLEASKAGVQILAYDSIVEEDVLLLHKPIPVHLD